MVTEIFASIGMIAVGFAVPMIIVSIVISNSRKKEFLEKLREDVDNLQLEVGAINYVEDKLHEDESFKRHVAMDFYKSNQLKEKLKLMWRD